MILRVHCDCSRNLLDVTWTHQVQSQHAATPNGWVDVWPRSGGAVDHRSDRNERTPGKLDEWTHKLRCRCGQDWMIADRVLAAAWREHCTETPKRGVVTLPVTAIV